MDVQITDSFTKSLKRLMWHENKVYKAYALFRYDIAHFLKNIWRFRKELWSHDWWDYRFTLNMLERSLTIMVNKLELEGIEEDGSRMKKVGNIRRVLELLKNSREQNFIDRAELELGELPHNPFEFEDMGDGTHRLVDNDTPAERKLAQRIYKRARQIEEKEWKELWKIVEGDLRGWWD
jgi:hypothetical protein